MDWATLPEGIRLPWVVDSLWLRFATIPDGTKFPQTIRKKLYLKGAAISDTLLAELKEKFGDKVVV